MRNTSWWNGIMKHWNQNNNYDFVFADPAIICLVSGKLCKNIGQCTNCPTGYYIMFFDEEKLNKIMEAWDDTGFDVRRGNIQMRDNWKTMQ